MLGSLPLSVHLPPFHSVVEAMFPFQVVEVAAPVLVRLACTFVETNEDSTSKSMAFVEFALEMHMSMYEDVTPKQGNHPHLTPPSQISRESTGRIVPTRTSSWKPGWWSPSKTSS